MDRATDTVYIANNRFDEQTHALLRIAKLKGLHVVPQSATTNANDLSIIYLGIQMTGWWPAVDLILDVRPYPNLLPADSRSRGIMRESVNLVFKDAFNIGMFHQLYQPRLGAKGLQLPNGSPTILDAAIASFANTPVGEMFSWIAPLRGAVDAMTAPIADDLSDTIYGQLASA